MQLVNKIEMALEKALEPIPSLPNKWRKWIATNLWWITIIGVVLMLMSITASLRVVSIFGELSMYSIYYSGVNSGWYTFTSIVSVAFNVAILVFSIMAIKDLKNMAMKGWKYIFVATLLGWLSYLVSVLLAFNILHLIPNLLSIVITIAISAYLLFNIKPFFNTAKVVSKKATKTTKAKSSK